LIVYPNPNPNPNNGNFTLNTDSYNCQIIIYDLLGTIVYKNSMTEIGLVNIVLNNSSSGVYLVQIIGNTGRHNTIKIMVEN
jgi:hypothetical protein